MRRFFSPGIADMPFALDLEVLAALVVAVGLAFYVGWRVQRDRMAADRFASPRAHEICQKSRQLFGREPALGFTQFKRDVPEADAVMHRDVRDAFLAQKLTPERVQSHLGPPA